MKILEKIIKKALVNNKEINFDICLIPFYNTEDKIQMSFPYNALYTKDSGYLCEREEVYEDAKKKFFDGVRHHCKVNYSISKKIHYLAFILDNDYDPSLNKQLLFLNEPVRPNPLFSLVYDEYPTKFKSVQDAENQIDRPDSYIELDECINLLNAHDRAMVNDYVNLFNSRRITSIDMFDNKIFNVKYRYIDEIGRKFLQHIVRVKDYKINNCGLSSKEAILDYLNANKKDMSISSMKELSEWLKLKLLSNVNRILNL